MMNRACLKLAACAALAAVALVACTAETVTPGTAGPSETPAGEDPTGTTTDPSGADPADASNPPAKDAGVKPPSKPDAACTAERWYRDSDNDGFGALLDFTDSCDKPSGFVADKTDCDDTKASIKPTGIELCDAVDNDCDGKVNGSPTEAAACTAKAGTYAGTFSLYTAEKLGQTVINQMTCTGTTTQTVNLAGTVVVTGTTTCSYGGSLGGFAKTQTGTITASIRLDGTLEGTLVHNFDGSTQRTFPLKGTVENARIDATSTSSWKPSPMSAVPWEVKVTIAAPKS